MRTRMRMPDAAPALLLGLLVALGSACVNTAFTPATTMPLAMRPEGCYLDMIFEGIPPDAYVVIGQITTDSTAPGIFALGENNEVALQRMQAEACRVGAHGLMHAGTSSQGVWTGNGYSRSTSGGAVAFVYVDPYGRPTPPPRGPRTLIHPGGLSAPQPAAPPPGTPPPSAAPPAPPPAPPPPPAPDQQ
jgi:hypothetical protein